MRRGTDDILRAARRLVILFALLALPASPVAASSPTALAPTQPISLEAVTRVRCLQTLPGHAQTLLGLAFSSDGRFFGSATLDGVVQLWDRSTWQVIQEFAARSLPAWRLFFLPDNARLSLGNGSVWSIVSGELERYLGRGYKVAFSSDGIWMAASNEGQSAIQLWSTADWEVEREIATGCPGDFLAFSPDSQLLAFAANEVPNGPDLAVKLWNATTGQELFVLRGHRNILHGMAFSPDGRWLAAASMDTTIRIWDVLTGELARTLQTGGGLFDIAFSPDGSLVAVAVDNRTVELWDVAGGQLVRALDHGGEVVSVAFSSDGTLLASGAYDSKIYLWGIPR